MTEEVLVVPPLAVAVVAAVLGALFGGAVLALRIYAAMTRGVCTSAASMRGKTVLVTGANSGIGKETAKEMARRGARVLMACRNQETAEKARAEVLATAGEGASVEVVPLDLSSLESVRACAKRVLQSERRLDVLVHNAGYANTFARKLSADGHELTMATNHLGPFLLTHLLIDLLKRSKPARVVVVASELYRLARLDPATPLRPRALPAYLYYVSKLANVHFTLELARRLEGSGVTANCLHPGMIDSGIWRNVPFPLNLPVKLIAKGFFKTPEQGAQTSIFCAVSEELEGVSGKYYLDCKEHGLSAAASDAAVAKKLWEKSEELVGLKEGDPRI
ncbi:hypothetical protein R5R35_014720 [Gryllus longicercus]